MNKNIILCGVGGQGTVLASKLLAAAAMKKDIPVKTAETIGMAQRGGSVTSHIRLGADTYSPLVPMGRAGAVIVSSRAVMPVTAALAGSNYQGGEMIDYLHSKVDNLTVVDTDAACAELGSSKIVNVLLLGAAVNSGETGLTKDDIRTAIKEKVNPKFHELNFKALDYLK